MMKTIELSKFSPSSAKDYGGRMYGIRSDPFAIYFVYPKDGEPVVVKGMSEEVCHYVEKNFPVALYHYTYWKNGRSRGRWQFINSASLPQISRYIEIGTGKNFESVCNNREVLHYNRYKITIYRDKTIVKSLYFRRMPKKWIPEFDLE